MDDRVAALEAECAELRRQLAAAQGVPPSNAAFLRLKSSSPFAVAAEWHFKHCTRIGATSRSKSGGAAADWETNAKKAEQTARIRDMSHRGDRLVRQSNEFIRRADRELIKERSERFVLQSQ